MFKFLKAEDKKLLEEVFRFRYEILCEELKLFDKEKYPQKIEKDEFDRYSINYVALDEDGNIAATIRLIHHSPIGYPTENHMKIDKDIKKRFDREKLGELSRIFVSKKYRNLKDTKKIMDGFKVIVYDDLKRLKIDYTYGALEKSFYRLLHIFNMKYEIIGELQEYGGKRYPAILYTDILAKYNPTLLKRK